MTLGAAGGAVKPLTRAETLALPPAISLADLGRALGVSEPVIRAQHRSGHLAALGIRIVSIGSQHRVVTSTVWRFLGIGPDGQAGGTDPVVPAPAGARQRGPASSALRSVAGNENIPDGGPDNRSPDADQKCGSAGAKPGTAGERPGRADAAKGPPDAA